MERRVSLDMMDNATYEEQSKRFQGLPEDEEAEVVVPAHRESISTQVDVIAPIDFQAQANAFYTSQAMVLAQNPQLTKLPSDFLYHIGFSSEDPLEELFGDVKFVIMGGSNSRMEKFTKKVARELNVKLPVGSAITDLSVTDRYCMFKAGPMLAVSHGMGMPSISILLHEITKMLYYAKAKGVVYIRMGTSGGLGLPPGSIVVSTEALDGLLRPQYRQLILGKVHHRDGKFNEHVSQMLASCWDESTPIVMGKTVSTDDFYEGQGRLDGAICEYEEQDKMNFLHLAHSQGVRNIEMESLAFAAFCHKLNIPAAMCAVTLLNRLRGDQVPADTATLSEYSDRPQRLVVKFMKRVAEAGYATF